MRKNNNITQWFKNYILWLKSTSDEKNLLFTLLVWTLLIFGVANGFDKLAKYYIPFYSEVTVKEVVDVNEKNELESCSRLAYELMRENSFLDERLSTIKDLEQDRCEKRLQSFKFENDNYKNKEDE